MKNVNVANALSSHKLMIRNRIPNQFPAQVVKIIYIGNRFTELYKLSKKNQKKTDVPTDEYLFEKNKEEYTFAPMIIKQKVDLEKSKEIDPMIDATIERLKKGRAERERVKMNTERYAGSTGMRFDVESKKFKQEIPDPIIKKSLEEVKKQMKKEVKKQTKKPVKKEVKKSIKNQQKDSNVPTNPAEKSLDKVSNIKENKNDNTLKEEEKKIEEKVKETAKEDDDDERLYIDVNLGDTTERIIVHKGDTAAELAAKFAADHSIKLILYRLGG